MKLNLKKCLKCHQRAIEARGEIQRCERLNNYVYNNVRFKAQNKHMFTLN